MSKRLWPTILFMALTLAGAAQPRASVSGYVTDALSGESLIAAEVISGKTGAVTDADGRYSLSLHKGPVVLEFYYAGYRTERVSMNLQRDTSLHVTLTPGESLAEARVVASGETGIRATQMGAHDISLEALRKMPVVLGEADVLKTVQLLPGVQGGMEGFSGIYVRGGGADENLFLMDGVPLYNVSHMLGVFSAFTPEAVKKATLYKGAFPARYGGRISGIMDIRTNDGDLYHTHGVVSVGLLTSRLHLDGPIVRGKTSYSFSGRLMHSALFSPFLKWQGNDIGYFFYDLNGKIVHRFSDRDRLFLTAYHGNDVFHYKTGTQEAQWTGTEEVSDMNWGNTMASLRWHHVFNGQWAANTIFSFNRYGMVSEFAQTIRREEYDRDIKRLVRLSDTYDSRYYSHIQDFSLQTDLDWKPVPAHQVRFGLSAIRHFLSPSTKFKQTDDMAGKVLTEFEHDPTYTGWETALYAEDEIRLGARWTVHPGLRYVWMAASGTNYHSLQPRLSTRFDFGRGVAVKAGYARMGQYVHQLSSSRISLPSDLWVPATGTIKPLISDIVSLGAFYDGLPGWECSLEAYYKYSQNVIDYRDGASMFGTTAGWEQLVEMGYARSRGLELQVERTAGKLKGWLSYTLSKTERRYPSAYVNGGNWFPHQYDRRHVLHLYVNYVFSPKADLSATWSFSSGGWMTVTERASAMLNLQQNKIYNRIDKGSVIGIAYIPSRNNYQLPPSHTLNLALNLNRQFTHGERTMTISLYNVYNAMNPNLVIPQRIGAGRHWSAEDRYVLKTITFLPILPSFSYTYRF